MLTTIVTLVTAPRIRGRARGVGWTASTPSSRRRHPRRDEPRCTRRRARIISSWTSQRASAQHAHVMVLQRAPARRSVPGHRRPRRRSGRRSAFAASPRQSACTPSRCAPRTRSASSRHGWTTSLTSPALGMRRLRRISRTLRRLLPRQRASPRRQRTTTTAWACRAQVRAQARRRRRWYRLRRRTSPSREPPRPPHLRRFWRARASPLRSRPRVPCTSVRRTPRWSRPALSASRGGRPRRSRHCPSASATSSSAPATL
mmetsp:Transcript_21160/g.74626  ORF Transcript_21160/g.74626 Transcript_21160/m.74626 type:complete len:259 (-) Transcript_21160:832-1608(-)